MPDRIEDWEIGAFVDGELGADRRREIADAAERRPEIAHKIDSYAAHKSLLAAATDLPPVDEPLPPALETAARRLSRATMVTAWLRQGRALLFGPGRFAALLLVGAVIGWSARDVTAPTPAAPEASLTFVDEATEAHRTLSLAPTFATDVAVADFGKLSEMFSEVIDPAALTVGGLVLTKVDIASTDNGPAVQFLFFDAEARPVSLLLSMNSSSLAAVGLGDRDTVVTSYNDFAVAYGRHDGIAYAVTAALPERRVGEIARQLVASAGFSHR